MNNRIIIRGLLITLVISLLVAGAYACEVDSHTDNNTTDNVDGIYLSGLGNVADLEGFTPEIACYIPDPAPAALNS